MRELLNYEAVDLVEDANNILCNINKSINDISDASPNKHTEETLRDYERKAERISEKKIIISNKYADYIMKYPTTTGMNDILTLCTEATMILKKIRQGVEDFRKKAAPKVGYEEVTYARLKDTNAPNLVVSEYKGESSLAVYLEWVHEHKRLPSNLLNTKLAATLPPLIHSRLSQQHPENNRTMDEVIKFLLKTCGRTAKIEEQLRAYHTSVGTLNSLVISGYTMNPYNCKEIISTADKHLLGLRSIAKLKNIYTTYLGTSETELCFQEFLHTHGYCSWLASNILTMTQVSQFTEMPISTGEGKIKWIINQIEDLRQKADRIVSSGVTESMQTATANTTQFPNL